MAEALRVVVDSNEASVRGELVDRLRLLGCEVEVRRLPVCDFVVSDRCGVERKDARDFFGSLKSGRLLSQARDIAAAYERPVLALEGSLQRVFRRSLMRPASIYGALASLALDFGFSIIPTEGVEATAVLIHRLAYREQATEHRPLQLRSVRRQMPPHEQQIFLLQGLPRVGSILAAELLGRFDTPYRVFEEMARAEWAASNSGKSRRLLGPLSEVRGMGPITAENARRLLTGSYRELLGEGDPG